MSKRKVEHRLQLTNLTTSRGTFGGTGDAREVAKQDETKDGLFKGALILEFLLWRRDKDRHFSAQRPIIVDSMETRVNVCRIYGVICPTWV